MKVGTPATLVKRIEARILLMRGERVPCETFRVGDLRTQAGTSSYGGRDA
jgi:hypothetical protein